MYIDTKFIVRKDLFLLHGRMKFFKKNCYVCDVVVAETHTALHESVQVGMLKLEALCVYERCIYSARLRMVLTHCSIYIM